MVAVFSVLVVCSLVTLCLYTVDDPATVVDKLRALSPFTAKSADPTSSTSASRLDVLFPSPDTEFRDFWPDVNNIHMRALVECLEKDTCRANQTKVVIFASWDFTFAIKGHVSGENIWCARHHAVTRR